MSHTTTGSNRKRGRPKKNLRGRGGKKAKVQEDIFAKGEEKLSTCSTELSVPNPVDSVASPVVDHAIEVSTTSANKQKRGRGRPKKNLRGRGGKKAKKPDNFANGEEKLPSCSVEQSVSNRRVILLSSQDESLVDSLTSPVVDHVIKEKTSRLTKEDTCIVFGTTAPVVLSEKWESTSDDQVTSTLESLTQQNKLAVAVNDNEIEPVLQMEVDDEHVEDSSRDVGNTFAKKVCHKPSKQLEKQLPQPAALPTVSDGNNIFECVVKGTKHQANFENGQNSQCVIMSTCALLYSVATDHKMFTSNDIDTILTFGNENYMNFIDDNCNGEPRHLDPEEIPLTFNISHFNVNIEKPEWVFNGLYPSSHEQTDVGQSVEYLATNLENNFKELDSTRAGFLFTGRGTTVSIWKANDAYYLFDSHQADDTRQYNANDQLNKAHLFKCRNILQLSRLILNNATALNQYQVHRIKITAVSSSEPDVICVASGTMHQGNIANGGNSQCVVLSHFALGLSAIKNRGIFNTEEIDILLQTGTQFYVDEVLQGGTPRFIYPDEMPENFEILNHSINISTNWIDNGLYPKDDSEINETISNLTNMLENVFARADFDSNKDGILFTGRNYTFSLWRSNNIYYMFNSHAVDSKNTINVHSDHLNKARLFKVKDVKALATLLLANASYNRTQPQYSIHHVKVLNWNENLDDVELRLSQISIEEDSTTVSTTSCDKDSSRGPGRPKKKTRGPKKKIDNIENNKKDVSFGRPQKKTRGPKKQIDDAHLLASTKYNKSHPEVHQKAVVKYAKINPDVNRDAVAKYTKINPEVHRDAVQKYKDIKREQTLKSNIDYNRVRSIPQNLRKGGLIGEKSGTELDTIPLFSLKKSSLLASDIYKCGLCNARLFDEEKNRKQWCCGQGAYNILDLPPITEPFYSDPEFIKHARGFNNLFTFSAQNVSHGWQYDANSPGFVKIQGRTYHNTYNLSVSNRTNPIGLYIDDGEERKRLAEYKRLKQDILTEITNYLHEVNPFIDCFKRLHSEASEEAHIIFQRTSRETHGSILGDMPRGNEVAAILSTDREQIVPRSITVWKIGDQRPHRVEIFHPLYEAFQYPLLYPHGGAGWYLDILCNDGKQKLSQVKYYRCLALSQCRFSEVGRLAQEWLVDMYCRVEEQRLQFISNQQKCDSNSSALRSGPMDEVAAAADSNFLQQIAADETVQGEGGVVPGRIYLPNTFTGSPRYMKCKYMDAIAIVSRLGRPSYFLTVTCNPKWPEISQNTRPNIYPSAIVCARAFNLRLVELIRDLRSGRWFGKCEYIMYVIEFQKRGMPHAHICFRVEGGGPVQNMDIDKVVRADIPPEQEAGGRLRTIVLNHMIHGPCGVDHRTDLPCWDSEKSKCTKYFPKTAAETTHLDERGFVHLKRNAENTGTITYRRQPVTVNDQWVVPYNAALLLKYDCHMNLEIASTRKIIKYLFKYMTKGPDEARVAIVPDDVRNDEVEYYVTKRYIGACDAAWRIFEFDVTSREPNVKQLPVHLENRHTIFFRQGQEAEAVGQGISDLMVYFQRPIEPEFDGLTYQDFYENYIVHTRRPTTKNVTIYPICDGKKFVTKRQRGELVARLFWVTPNRGEQFYLRLLLATYSCRSYADLYALGGPDCATFQEAARALGIVNDEDEYETALREAATFYTGKRLRRFFVLLITNGAPALILWEKLKLELSEDFLERFVNDEERAFTAALLEIDRLLRKHGTNLQEHGLPVVEDNTTELGREREEYSSRTDELRSYVERWLPLLSSEQKHLFDHVNDLLTTDTATTNNNSSSTASRTAIFLDGPSGTGKTLILNVLVAHVRATLKGVALCTASSAIAAQNYEGGMTAHSMFRLPIEFVDDTSYWNLTNGTQRAELIREASLIIYDEAPMAHKYLIHILDRSLRDLMGSTEIFGGKVVILAGDFRQIPPVVPKARCHNDVVQASLRMSQLWPQLAKFSLTEAQRTRTDDEYSNFLLSLGSGEYESHAFGTGSNKQMLVSLAGINVVTELNELIDFVFPADILQDPDTCASRAIISTHNVNVNEINAQILERIEGEYIHCYSVDSVEREHADEFYLGLDMLHRVHAKGVPDYDLVIKKGCVCIIMRNLSFVDSLINGTKVIVVNVTPRLVTVRKPGKSETYMIPRISFKFPVEPDSPIDMHRKQFPLQVCYAMTVHKSQGQTIDRVGVDLRSDVFSHGQLYVALGRVRNKNNIKVLLPSIRIMNDVPYSNNVVIADLLR